MRVNENNAAPRPYELARPEELARLMNECCGYLRTCRAAQHGTDSDGRGHAIDALPRAAAEIGNLRAQLAEAVGLLKPFAECVRANDRRGDGVLVSVDPIERHKAMAVELGALRRAQEFIERVGK